MYYVYALLDSSKNDNFEYLNYKFEYEPFYIGKGTGNRFKETLYDKTPFKKNKIKKLINNKVKIITVIIEHNLTNEEAISLEIELIKKIGRRNLGLGPLVNLTDGGDGRKNSNHSEETKLKISKSRKGKAIGWKHSDETLKIMSIKQSGENNGFYNKTHSDENKKKQSNRVSGDKHPMYNKIHSKETIKKLVESRKKLSNDKLKDACQIFNKEVIMYDLNMIFIKEFKSVKEASESTNINESLISKCCRGEIKSPTRYFFKYKNETDNIKNNKFLINEGDLFIYDNNKYELIKRNKKTCICRSNDTDYTIHENDFKYLFEKDTNDSNITELYLFIKSYKNNTKLKEDIISVDDKKIKYIKLINNSEIFKEKNHIYHNDDIDIFVFEDEWINKKEIVKSRILNLINLSNKIWARKCEIREIDNNILVRDFLINNHIQGYVGSKLKLGLFYNNELVSLMTFGNLRKNMGQLASEGSWELLRFCNKLNTSVVGGASKLLNHFIKKYNPINLISYADRRWSNGNMYEQIGFTKLGNTIPNYFYIIDNKREARFKYRKDILIKEGFDGDKTEVKIMHERGYYRIFDKGSIKYEYKR
jgi:group I intron endonuclease